MAQSSLHIYTICLRGYDSPTQLYGCLYNVRRNYFENGVSEKKIITDYTNGICTKHSYYISQWGMGWKKTVDDRLLEYSSPEQDGCAIFFRDSNAHHYAKAVYNNDLDWVKTYYKNMETNTVAYVLELVDERGVLLLTAYDPNGTEIGCTKLYAAFSEVHTPINDWLDAQTGKPMVYAATNRGEVCFCTAEQARQRGAAMETMETAASTTNSEDIMAATHNWDERGAQLFAECVQLLRGAELPEEMDPVLKEAISETGEDQNVSEEFRKTVQETEEWIRQLSARPAGSGEQRDTTHELYSYSSLEEHQQDEDVAEIMSIIHSLEVKNNPNAVMVGNKISIGKSLQEELESVKDKDGKLPSKYMVSGKRMGSRMVHATEVFGQKKGNRAV